MRSIKQKENEFYRYFQDFSKDLMSCTQTYADTVKGWPDTRGRITEVAEWANVCDEHTDRLAVMLAKTFVTPFDRAQINSLAFALDDIADLEEDLVARFDLFGVEEPLEEAFEIVDLHLQMAAKMVVIFEKLPGLKSDGTARERAREIRKLESECDRIYRNGLAKVFSSDYEPVVLLRWTKLLDALERISNAMELVASEVRIVLIENG
jgi:predicted phosphate transport protein (TIGR00153 family)